MEYSIQPAPALGGEWVWPPEMSRGQRWSYGAPQYHPHRAGQPVHRPTGSTGLTGFDELSIPAEQAKRTLKGSV